MNRRIFGWALHRSKLAARAAIGVLPLSCARQILYLFNFRSRLNLESPRSFNEKVNWRIVHDRSPALATLSSKVDSKCYAVSACPDISIPRTIWHGTNLDELRDIDISGQWVLKASHQSGDILFGEGQPDLANVKKTASGWLRRRGRYVDRLWAYSQVRAEYILEERIGSPLSVPNDYKFFVFDGTVRMVQVDHGRFGSQTRNLYSADWSPLPYTYTWPRGKEEPAPQRFGIMAEFAAAIGAGIDFVRVDLFNVNGAIYFGEATVYPAAGLSHWPAALDRLLGSYWTVPAPPDLESGTSRSGG